MANKRIRVFLAHSHEDVRASVISVLCEIPRIEIAGECLDGLDVAGKAAAVGADLVIMSIQMPAKQNIDAWRELKELTTKVEGVRVLILGPSHFPEFVRASLMNGAMGVISKASIHDELATAVDKITHGQLYVGLGTVRGALSDFDTISEGPLSKLTPRERQVLEMIAQGMTNSEIAKALGIATKTVDTHRMRIMRKVGAQDQASLLKFFLSSGLLVRSSKVTPPESGPLTLYFDLGQFTTAEVVEAIQQLSDIYEEIGGDRLIINDLTVFGEVRETLLVE